jgi:hypothetical protein
VQNKSAFFSGSYNDLTDTPSIEDLTGPQGPPGNDGADGGSATWVDLQGRPAWTIYFGLSGTTDTVTIGANSFKSSDFAPNGQAVFDLGSSDARWRRVHTSGLRVYGEETVADMGMNAGDNRVTNVAASIAEADAATKKYVDDAVADVEGAPGERRPRGFPGADGADGADGQSIVGPPGTTPFSGITDKPTWVDKFSYDDIGQCMDPAQPSNFDIVVSDSLTPSANSAFNLSQDLRRFLFGYFQRVRLSGNTPHYDDEAIPYHFLRSNVAENARWFDMPRRLGWSSFFSLATPTMLSIGSNSLKCGDIIPNGPKVFDLGTADTPWKHIFTVAFTAVLFRTDALLTNANFSGIRLQEVGAPTADADAATKKYVDDTDAVTKTYVNTKDADTMTYVNTKDATTRTYVDAKDLATRTYVECVDTRLDDFS